MILLYQTAIEKARRGPKIFNFFGFMFLLGANRKIDRGVVKYLVDNPTKKVKYSTDPASFHSQR